MKRRRGAIAVRVVLGLFAAGAGLVGVQAAVSTERNSQLQLVATTWTTFTAARSHGTNTARAAALVAAHRRLNAPDPLVESIGEELSAAETYAALANAGDLHLADVVASPQVVVCSYRSAMTILPITEVKALIASRELAALTAYVRGHPAHPLCAPAPPPAPPY